MFLKGLKCINGRFFSMRGRGLKLFFKKRVFSGRGMRFLLGN